MDPITTIMTITTGLGQAIELTKNLREVDLKLNAAENKFKIAELYNALTDVKMNIADLKIELIKKDEVIKDLEAKLKLETEMIWKDPFYFYKNEKGQEEGPFCHNCYDIKKQLVRIPQNFDSNYLHCSACDKTYDKSSGRSTRSLPRSVNDDF